MRRLSAIVLSFMLLTAFVPQVRKHTGFMQWEEVTELKGKVRSARFTSVKRYNIDRNGIQVRVTDTVQSRAILLDRYGNTLKYTFRRGNETLNSPEVFDYPVYSFTYNGKGDLVNRVVRIGGRVWVDEIDYDNDGRELGSRKYDEDGRLITRTELKYDINGQLASSMQYHVKVDTYLSQRIWYFNKGRQTKTEVYAKDGSIKEWNNTSRDTIGNAEEYIDDGFGPDGKEHYEKTVTTFGHDLKVISTAVYTNKYDMNVSFETTSIDRFGHPTEKRIRNDKGELVSKEVWRYDDEARETDYVLYQHGILKWEGATTYNFNTKKQLVEKVHKTIYPPERGIKGEEVRDFYTDYDAKSNCWVNTTIFNRGNGSADTVWHFRDFKYY
jgi:hypothetical protein